VERYSLACQRFLLKRDVKLVMVACNTASANALPALAAASDVAVIGAVRPGAQSSLQNSKSHRIGVIGTLATIASRAYESAISELDPNATVSALACPLLVPLAEEGWTDGPIARAIAERYLRELFTLDPDIDTLVLGCTHYPLLGDELSRVANAITKREIRVVDSAMAMARSASALLGDSANHGSDKGTLEICVTDATRMEELSPRFLGEAVSGGFELVDL
jgi:glutamate racemase